MENERQRFERWKRKLPSIEDRGPTDRFLNWNLTLTFKYKSYDPYMRKVEKLVETDRKTNGGDCITSRANAVVSNWAILTDSADCLLEAVSPLCNMQIIWTFLAGGVYGICKESGYNDK